MKKYTIKIRISEEIEAETEEEALEKFWEYVETTPQQTLQTYLSDHILVEEELGNSGEPYSKEALQAYYDFRHQPMPDPLPQPLSKEELRKWDL